MQPSQLTRQMITGYRVFMLETYHDFRPPRLQPLYMPHHAGDWQPSEDGWAAARCYCCHYYLCPFHDSANNAMRHMAGQACNCPSDCGFYTARDLGAAVALALNTPPYTLSRVLAHVELSGIVIEHEKGWRGSKARILDLLGPSPGYIWELTTGRVGILYFADRPALHPYSVEVISHSSLVLAAQQPGLTVQESS